MPSGLIVTVVTIILTFITGILTAIGLMAWLWGWKPIQRVAFPFIDEIARSTRAFNAELKETNEPDFPKAMRQGLWLIAYAIVTAATISGLLNLVGQLATPAG